MELEVAAAALQELTSRFELVFPRSPDQLDDVFRLRYQVYCLERGFEPARNGRESDRFDPFARHALVRDRASHQPVGTVRLVPPAPGDSLLPFPINKVCDPGLLRHLPRARTAEISRFALSKNYRTDRGVTGLLLRLFLMRGVIALSGELGLTHWCALMEPCLMRLLRASSIHFQTRGPPVEHHGLRQPAGAVVADVLTSSAREQPLFWDFVTEGGRHGDVRRLELAA